MRDHIQRGVVAATERIQVTSRHLLKTCLNHIHVLENLGLFTLESLEADAPGKFTIAHTGQPPEVPKLTKPTAMRIGDEHVQSLLTVYSPSAFIPVGEFRGDGFVLRVEPGQEPTALGFTMSFPSRRPIQP